MITISTLTRNTAGDAIVSLLDGGHIELRTGTKPASPQTAATGTLLATLVFSDPAFSSFSNGRATVNSIAADENIAASGICGWFRLYGNDDQAVMDGTVTIVGGGGDIEFDDINFIQGGTVSISELNAIVESTCVAG